MADPIAKKVRPASGSPLLTGTTDFTRLTRNQKSVWVKKLWQHARNYSFVMRFSGASVNSMIQRINELTKTEKGEKAIIQLVQDLTGQGVTGDFALEGREEEIRSFDTEITIDQLRNATRNVGRMTDQRNVLNFREQSKDKLGYWVADIIDQLGFLTLSGVPYHFNTNGSIRGTPKGGTVQSRDTELPLAIGSFSGTSSSSYGYDSKSGTTLAELEFAKRVRPPSKNRQFRWDSATKKIVSLAQEAGKSTQEKRINFKDNIKRKDYICYDALLAIRAELKTKYMRGIRGSHGDEFYHIFIHPKAYLTLKQDPDYKDAIKNAYTRGSSNPIFSGGTVTIDGMILHEYHHVFNTLGSAPGLKAGIKTADLTAKNNAITKMNEAKTKLTTAEVGLAKLEKDLLVAVDKYEAAKNASPLVQQAVTDATTAVTAAKKAVSDQQKLIKTSTTAYLDALKKADSFQGDTDGAIDYCRVLVCGAQSLGMCTIDASPIWVEKHFDYDNSMGIASGKIFGFEKPQFPSREFLLDTNNFDMNPYSEDALEDFGVAVLDVPI